VALTYHLLLLAALVTVVLIGLRGWKQHARAREVTRCDLCGEPGCDGALAACVGRWR
jgi:hypothetical protein